MERKDDLLKNCINVHQRLGTDVSITSEQMDTERLNTRTYDYLCRLEEARNWISEITEVPESYEEFEENMRKGIYLAEVAKYYSPNSVKSIFIDSTLQYRHTDNINFFLQSLEDLKLPRHFYFEVIDLYEKKNFVKVVYCVHALAHYLNAQGKTGGIVSATGKVFSKSDMERMDNELASVKMPSFENIQNDMTQQDTRSSCKQELLLENEDMENLKTKVRAELLEEADSLEEIEQVVIRISMEDRIALKLKTFLYYKAFNEIYYKKNVTLFSLRKFLFIFFKDSVEMLKENQIDEYHKKINHKLKEIYNKEVYLEDIESRVKLMLDNKLDVYNIKHNASSISDINIKPIQELLQILQTRPECLKVLFDRSCDIDQFISTVVMPLYSNVCGKKEEYLFINLVNYMTTSGEHGKEIAYKLILHYFRNSSESDVFKKGLYEIVNNLKNIDIECNPTEIHKELYGIVKSLDESLENKKVQEIYERRLGLVRGVVKSFFEFVDKNVFDIPYIVRYYIKTNKTKHFFKDFLFPFLLVSDVFNSKVVMTPSLRNKVCQITNVISKVVDRNMECMEEGFSDNSSISMGDNSSDSKCDNSSGSMNEKCMEDGRVSDNRIGYTHGGSSDGSMEDNRMEYTHGGSSDGSMEDNRIGYTHDGINNDSGIEENRIGYTHDGTNNDRVTNKNNVSTHKKANDTDKSVVNNKNILNDNSAKVNDIMEECFKNIADSQVCNNHSMREPSAVLQDISFSVYLPILSALNEMTNKCKKIMINLTNVSSLDHYFQLESMHELVRVKKSVIYMPVNVINNILLLLKENADVCDDELSSHARAIELLPADDNAVLTFSLLSSDWINRTSEEEIAIENFIKSVKKKLIYIIKCISGKNVTDLLLKQCTDEEIQKFNNERVSCDKDVPTFLEEDIEDLKESLMDDMKFLEDKNIVNRSNLYNEILAMLADDIFVLKFMSIERSKELKVNELTFSNLLSKEEYLDAKIEEYEEYIDAYASRMAIKNVRYDKNSPIVKMNKESKYGSYYFTSTELFDKKVLHQIYDIPDARDIFFILVSHKPLVFMLEVYINNLLVTNPYNFRLEDILTLKRNRQEVFSVVEICSFNTEQFIKLLNSKYVVSY